MKINHLKSWIHKGRAETRALNLFVEKNSFKEKLHIKLHLYICKLFVIIVRIHLDAGDEAEINFFDDYSTQFSLFPPMSTFKEVNR